MCNARNYIGWIFIAGFLAAEVFTQDSDGAPRIYALHIRSEIQFRFATTHITSRVANPKNYTQDTVFEVILPDEAFISNFTMEIDGQIYPGVVKEKGEARKDFEKAKERGQSAGHISKSPRFSRKFKVEIAIAGLSKVSFNLVYQELLKRVRGSYEHRIFINPGQPVDDFQVGVVIRESRDITSIRVPPIKNLDGLLSNDPIEEETPNKASIFQQNPRTAFIRYAPSLSDQSDKGVAGQFLVQYDVDRSLDGGDVLVANGYFVHFFAPDVPRSIPKDILFLLDVSTSMTGRKINQLKDAMYVILDDLKEGDRMNIITFSDTVTLYEPSMVDVTSSAVHQAKLYVKNDVYPNGWTDINSAMLDGIDFVRQFQEEDERAPIILFLTDGRPSSGEQSQAAILNNIRKANKGHISLYTLAFGNDADWNLVKSIAVQNNGIARQIYEDSDSALQISNFYDELSEVLLNDVKVSYLGDTVDNDTVTKSSFKNYFKGSEIVVAGKLADSDVATVDLEISGSSVDGEIKLSDKRDSDVRDLMEVDDIVDITEKLWAYLTIKQLHERAAGAVSANPSLAANFTERAKDLAIKYGFVTKSTSMVVTKPDAIYQPEKTEKETKTPIHSGGRPYRAGGAGDPHYTVTVGTVEHPLCFDVRGEDGEIHNLINDPKQDIVINSKIVSDGHLNSHGELKSFIGQISVQTKHHVIVIMPDAILYGTEMVPWNEEKVLKFEEDVLELLDRGRLLKLTFSFGSEILIRRQPRKNKVSYLDFFINNEDGFSKHTTGLIGQFVNEQKQIVLKSQHSKPNGDTVGKFHVKEGARFLHETGHLDAEKPEHHTFRAILTKRPVIATRGTEACWMVERKNQDIIHGDKSTYITQDFLNL